MKKRIIAEFSEKGISFDEAVKTFDFTPYTGVCMMREQDITTIHEGIQQLEMNARDTRYGLDGFETTITIYGEDNPLIYKYWVGYVPDKKLLPTLAVIAKYLPEAHQTYFAYIDRFF